MTTNASFGSDNHSGVHSSILAALAEANCGHAHSYGLDEVTNSLQVRCQEIFGSDCKAYPVFNGTAANVVCLSRLVEPYHAILAASTSHLYESECGAPERILGSKVIAVPSTDGKLTPEMLQPYLVRQGDQHFAQPKAVSISQPTEYGTVYSLDELAALRDWARKNSLLIHIDGARLIYSAAFLNCSFKEIIEASGAAAVSFGGTKNGLLFGELCLIFGDDPDFKYARKQLMQLPSKQRFLSAQFLQFFSDDLWKSIANHGNHLAHDLAKRLQEFPEVKITQAVQSNAVFAIFPKAWVKDIRKRHFFYVWDEKTFESRLLISFDHSVKDIDSFILAVSEAKKRGKNE